MKFFLTTKKYLIIIWFFALFLPSVGFCQNKNIHIIEPPEKIERGKMKEENHPVIDDKIVNPVINPATKYCNDLGYKWEKRINTDGSEDGICVMPDGKKLDEWDFALGKAGEDWSYCYKKGLKLKIISNVQKCQNVLSKECAVCISDDGKEQEVTKLLQTDIENNIVAVNNRNTIATVGNKNIKVLALVLLFTIIIVLIIFVYHLLVKEQKQ